MKTKCFKFNVKCLALICLFAVNANAAPSEGELYNLVNDFLNVDSCNKSFEQFACELQQLLCGDPQYAKFCNDLNGLKKKRNAQVVALTLLKHKGIMPNSIKTLLTSRQKELLGIVKRRVGA